MREQDRQIDKDGESTRTRENTREREKYEKVCACVSKEREIARE